MAKSKTEPLLGELLLVQVNAMVQATADLVCEDNKKSTPIVEARLYGLLAKEFVAKHNRAKRTYAQVLINNARDRNTSVPI